MSDKDDWLTHFDKSSIEVTSFEEADRADREFWRSKSPIERLQALEHIRQLAWGYGNGKRRPEFQRTFEVLELSRG